jgi:hypothetical protein
MKTAVEKLEMKIVVLEKYYNIPHEIYVLCEKAKVEERENIINAANQDEFVDESGFGIHEDITKGEQYYNETFNKKES